MSTEVQKETMEFQTEVRQLLDLVIHSLYSNKEIFLRELVSNASDAIDKLRFEGLSDEALFEGDPDFGIWIDTDEQAKTITIRDNGIGMSREEVISNIGTIAKSGTREFFQALTGDQAKDTQLIGQFGVGFYSAFIVADKVTVNTRRAGMGAEHGVRWESGGTGEYTLENTDREQRGTEIVLHLRDEEDEFLYGHRLRAIVNKYSDHITLPIRMRPMPGAGGEEGEEEKKEEAPDYEQVNKATALWAMSKKDISDEEYAEFYKHVAHDFGDPLAHVHSRVEGKLEYTSLLYIPEHAPFDIWDRQVRHGVKLYVRRVFITDDAEQLMPPFLRFVRGVVDSEDLPLNISREILQHNKTIDSIRAGSVKKVLGLLESLAKDEPEKYATFWGEFGKILKEGVVEDFSNRDTVANLLRFASTHNDTDAQDVSLADYASRMAEGQEKIWYVTADNWITAKNSPHLEVFKKHGIEVLLLTDPIDEWVVNHLTEFEGKHLQSVSKGTLDETDIGGAGEEAEDKPSADEYKELLEKIGKSLEGRVEEVRITRRLTQSPACLVAGDHGLGAHMERIMQAAGQAIPASKPILEINPEHPIVARLREETDEQRASDWSSILFDQARLSEGGQLDDPAGFVSRLNDMFMTMSGTPEK